MDDLRAVTVAVGFAREALASPWADHAWRVVGVAPAGETPPRAESVCDALELRLFGDEADHYLLNLSAPEPMLFVVWRLQDEVPAVLMVTVSYGEAARMLDAGENVEGVPLPADLSGWVEDFARRHYRPPEKKQKHKRYASTREESQP
ncbi:MAG: DUF3305 domain-containing protein [Rhodocyclaceae bacterium]|nr:DUF3305 domain-containing protein [Rhodocyclaceae bacterium]MBX3667357.1 DUF3305 domain-containing protein [Rhodocyclaceae bacterium]